MALEKVFYDLDKLTGIVRRAQSQRKKVVLANGCFDVVHGGHVSYLEDARSHGDLLDARSHGDLLVVGLNSDSSVRELKGENRPVCNEPERCAVLGALCCVDYVIVFSEATCENLLRTLRPDVHAKGTDYTVDDVPEKVVSDELGIETVITGNPKENATKTIIGKVNG